MDLLTDEELMVLFQENKDGQGSIAFDHLYCRYSKTMVNYFYYALHYDNDKAQDFLHDLFLKIIEHKNTFSAKLKFKPWIYRLAINMCKNEYRRKSVFKKYEKHVRSTNDTVYYEDRKAALKHCINSLESNERSLIILRFKFKMSVKEIAIIYNCPEGTIKSRLFKATRELSKIYKKNNHE